MKKIVATLLCTAAIVAHAQTVDDAKTMARCSAGFTFSATMLGESNPNFRRMIDEAQTSAAISRKFYQKIGMSATQTDIEAKNWLGTLTRQYSSDRAYVVDYLIDTNRSCGGDNVKLRRFL